MEKEFDYIRKNVWSIGDESSGTKDKPCSKNYPTSEYENPADEILDNLKTKGIFLSIVSMRDMVIPKAMYEIVGIGENDRLNVSFHDPDSEFGNCRFIKIRKEQEYDNPDFCLSRKAFSPKAEDLNKIGIHFDYANVDRKQGDRHAFQIVVGVSVGGDNIPFIYIRKKYTMKDWFGNQTEWGFTRSEKNFINKYLNPAFSHLRFLADIKPKWSCRSLDQLVVNCKRIQFEQKRCKNQ